MSKRKVKISSFLSERKDRFKPQEANKLSLKRVNKIDFSGNIHLVEHKPTRTNMILVKKGDLLISGINAEKGAVAVYEYEEDAIATIHYSSYSYDKSRIDIEYLKWFLKSNVFKQILIDQAGNGIKSELKPKKFLSLEINLPSLQDQKKMVKRLQAIEQELEELNALNDRNETLMNELHQSILQDAIEGRLTEEWRKKNPDIESVELELKKIKKKQKLEEVSIKEIPYEIPQSWSWYRLIDLIKEKPRNGYSPRGVNYETETKSLKLGATTQGVFNPTQVKYLDETIEKDSYLWLEDGDILIQRSNSLEYVGVSAIYRGNSHEFVYPDLMMKIKAVHESMINYLHIVLSSLHTRQYYRDNATGTSSNMPKINQTVVSNTFVPLPPPAEIFIIETKVDDLKDLCDQLESQVLSGKENTERLMQYALSEVLGQENRIISKQKEDKEVTKAKSRTIKYDSKTTFMELVELLKNHGKLHAEDLWKMSKQYDNSNISESLDKFYSELKKQVEEEKTIKEVKNEKGYLELA